MSFMLYGSSSMDVASSNIGTLAMHNQITLSIENYSLLTVTSGTVSVKRTFNDGTSGTTSLSTNKTISLDNVTSIIVSHSSSVCSASSRRDLSITSKFRIE